MHVCVCVCVYMCVCVSVLYILYMRINDEHTHTKHTGTSKCMHTCTYHTSNAYTYTITHLRVNTQKMQIQILEYIIMVLCHLNFFCQLANSVGLRTDVFLRLAYTLTAKTVRTILPVRQNKRLSLNYRSYTFPQLSS